MLDLSQAAFARRLVLPRNTMCLLGDSRIASQLAGTSTFGAENFVSQARAALGARFDVLYNGATSGYRSDRYLLNLPTAIQSSASWALVFGIYNDLVAGYTDTQIWNGYDAGSSYYTNGMKAALDALVQAGKHVIVCTEYAGTPLNAPQIAYLHRYNQRLREYAERQPGVVLFDLARLVWDQTSTSSSIALKSGYSSDGIHLGHLASIIVGSAFASLLAALMPDAADSFVAMSQQAAPIANPGVNGLANPLFLTTTGGTANTGISGTVPSGWNVSRSGSATATVSTDANADGAGNDMVIAATFTAAEEYILLGAFPSALGWATGDVFHAGVDLAIDAGSSGFWGATLRPYVQATGQTPVGDMFATGHTQAGPATAYKQRLKTPPNTVGAGAVSTVAWYLWLYGAGAGSVTARISRPWLQKRFEGLPA